MGRLELGCCYQHANKVLCFGLVQFFFKVVKCIPALQFAHMLIHMEIMFQKIGYFFI